MKTQKKITAVDIAKDALSLLEAGLIRTPEPNEGSHYVLFTADVCERYGGKSLQRALQGRFKHYEPCKVCADGALFMGFVLRLNEAHIPVDHRAIDKSEFSDRLSEYFSERQLRLIEAAFEQTIFPWMRFTENPDAYDTAIAWASKYGDKRERLIAILKNIIDNGGKFRPFVPVIWE